MVKGIDTEHALREVEGNIAFFVNDGKVINSLSELHESLTEMSDETYRFHASNNDFDNWIRDVFCDSKLANDLSKVKTKKTAAKRIEQRIDNLSK